MRQLVSRRLSKGEGLKVCLEGDTCLQINGKMGKLKFKELMLETKIGELELSLDKT